MDFDSYKNSLPYPAHADFTTTYFYKAGKCVATKKAGVTKLANGDVVSEDALKGCVTERVTDEAALREKQREYGHETARLEAKFKSDLFEDLGIATHPLREKLYSKAWEDGHSSGYAEVYNCAQGLVDLIELPKDGVLVTKDGVVYGFGFRFSQNALKIESLTAELQELL